MVQILSLFLLLGQLLLAEVTFTDKVTQLISEFNEDEKQEILKKKEQEEEERERLRKEQEQERLNKRKKRLLEELNSVNNHLDKDNIWSKVYANYKTYKGLEFKSTELTKRIYILNRKNFLTNKDKKALKSYEDNQKTTKEKLSQLTEYKEDPFKKLLIPDDIGKVPQVESPLDIIKALSFVKHLDSVMDNYNSRYESLNDTIANLHSKKSILTQLITLNVLDRDEYSNKLEDLSTKVKIFKSKLDIFKTRQGVLEHDLSSKKINIENLIEKEIEKGIVIGSIVLFLLLGFLFIKYLVRKYMSENELYYSTNKALNFTFITILALILLFSYLENVSHLATILGFASAGIAIALKDWFMSIMGWLVIIFSGSIHVGDRIKFQKDGKQYVGDVVDISILRMTLHEDITLTTESVNRRAGRIIFVPNNYIFTEMVANYSHSGLKTVWDGIDFMITFDSDVVKAQSIAKEVSRKYSKGYTDMTRKQLNRLRSKYSMRNTSVEPRIFAFLDENGVRISVWYLTNAYATLTLRSTISMEILTRIREEDRVSLAFPSQSVYLNRVAPKELKSKSEIFKEKFNKEHGKVPDEKYKPDDWGLY